MASRSIGIITFTVPAYRACLIALVQPLVLLKSIREAIITARSCHGAYLDLPGFTRTATLNHVSGVLVVCAAEKQGWDGACIPWSTSCMVVGTSSDPRGSHANKIVVYFEDQTWQRYECPKAAGNQPSKMQDVVVWVHCAYVGIAQLIARSILKSRLALEASSIELRTVRAGLSPIRLVMVTRSPPLCIAESCLVSRSLRFSGSGHRWILYKLVGPSTFVCQDLTPGPVRSKIDRELNRIR